MTLFTYKISNDPMITKKKFCSFLFCMGIVLMSVIPAFAQSTEQDQVNHAEKLIIEENYSEAFQIYNELWANNPENYDFRLKVGLLLGWMKDFGKSELHLTNMLDDYPNNIEVGTALMRVLSWQHKYSKSLKLGKELEIDYEQNLDLLTILAQTNYWSGSYSTAQRYANRLLILDPDNTIALNLIKEINAINSSSIEGGAIFPWDSEQTILKILSLRGLTNLNADTQFQLDLTQFDTRNERINIERKSRNISGALKYQLSHKYRLRTDLGVVKYESEVAGKSDVYLTGGVDFRYNDGKSTLNITANRNAIQESPFLIENRILMDALTLTYRYRHLNWTMIVDPQYTWLSDGNERFAANLIVTYLIETPFLFIRPAIKTKYLQYLESPINKGYFAPEQLTAGLASIEFDRNLAGSIFQFVLTGDLGYQKINHIAVGSDPKLLYSIKSEIFLTPNNTLRFSAGYSYTNLQTVSVLTQDPDYWYQSLFFKLRLIL